MDSTTQLAIAELVIYLIFLQFGCFLLYKHGKPGIEAWLFFTMFCVLRIIAAALQISDYETDIKKGKTPSNTASIVNSIGVAGMLLTISGMIHEAFAYQYNYLTKKTQARLISAIIHLTIVAGIAISTTGGAELSALTSTKDLDTWKGLLIAGYFITLVALLCIFAFALWTLAQLNSSDGKRGASSAKWLCYGAVVACLLVLVRIIYSIVFGFTLDKNLNPYSGAFWVKLVFISLVQMLASVVIMGVGFKTLGLKEVHVKGRTEGTEDAQQFGV